MARRVFYRGELIEDVTTHPATSGGIGTSHRDGVRQLVAEVMEYASVLRGMVLASEERATYTASGVLWPDKRMITAGRSYALGRYPHIVHIVKELAGQGPVLRWSEADFDNPRDRPMAGVGLRGRGHFGA